MISRVPVRLKMDAGEVSAKNCTGVAEAGKATNGWVSNEVLERTALA